MEILGVGDEIIVNGYKSIILTDDMEKNVETFATANNISKSEAERILYSIPALKNFAENFLTKDVEENIVITDLSLDEDKTEDRTENKQEIYEESNVDNQPKNIFDTKTNFSTIYETLESNANNNIFKELQANETKASTTKALKDEKTISRKDEKTVSGKDENDTKTISNKIEDETTVATSNPTNIKEQLITASSSSNNSNEIKNFLGVFGLNVNSQIEDPVYENNKLKSIKTGGKTYNITYYQNGIIKETSITENGKEIANTKYNSDGSEQEANQTSTTILATKEAMSKAILTLIIKSSKRFTEDMEKKFETIIEKSISDYEAGVATGALANYIALKLNEVGLNTNELKKHLSNNTPTGITIKDLCEDLINKIQENKNEDNSDQEDLITETKSIEGINFNISHAKGDIAKYEISVLEDGTIEINGENCTIDILGVGDSDKKIQLRGSNIQFNSNNVTFESITNLANISTINGSYGNDYIINEESGKNSIINGNDGDDIIENYATNTALNGNSGNDTINNFANKATINGGLGDDAINYTKNSATITPSSGNDIINEISNNTDTEPTPTPPTDSDEDDNKGNTSGLYSQTFTENGVTFTVYSDLPINITTEIYKNVLSINAENSKIVINSSTEDNSSIEIHGNKIDFHAETQLRSIFNYADNSTFTGSEQEDYIFNYADNVTIFGLGGNDKIINEGKNVIINGNDGDDILVNRENAEQTTIDRGDSNDKIYDEGQNTTITVKLAGEEGSSEYNSTLTKEYIHNALNGMTATFYPEPSEAIMSQIEDLANKLLTEANSSNKREFNETALKLINYAKKLDTSTTAKTDEEYLYLALEYTDIDGSGLIFEDELNETIQKADISEELETYLQNKNIKLIGLTDTEIENFIESADSEEAALKLLKQIEVIIETNTGNKDYMLSSIREILTNAHFSFNNEILEDAQMLIDAENSEDADEYIKSQMIKDGNQLSIAQMFETTETGEIMEKDDILYINDGETMVKLNISAETYLELFPPVSRYLIEQNSYNDCFFIATTMIDFMENDEARVKLLQLFSEDSSGNIKITFPGIADYPITFPNGELKVTDNKYMLDETEYSYQISNNSIVVAEKDEESTTYTLNKTTASLGLQMLEQAYALAKFAELSNQNITSADIEELGEALYYAAKDEQISANDASNIDIDKALTYYLYGGYAQEVYEDLTANNTTTPTYKKIKTEEQGKDLLGVMKSLLLDYPDLTMTTLISGNVDISEEDSRKYNIISGHQYSIENIDTIEKIVYIKNPWDSYKVAAIPYDVFLKYFYGFAYTKFD